MPSPVFPREKEKWFIIYLVLKGCQINDREIGYGINGEFKNRGYCTEAIEALVHWALKQDGVISVTAETDTDFLWRYQV